MWRKIVENAVVFVFLFGFISICVGHMGRTLLLGEVEVSLASQLEIQTANWESDYPASLLPDERINVNTASAEDLERLPSIGADRAADIVAHREEYGAFQTSEDLLAVYGIGTGILAGFVDYITLN